MDLQTFIYLSLYPLKQLKLFIKYYMVDIEKRMNSSRPSEGKSGRTGGQRVSQESDDASPVSDSKNLIGIFIF